MQLNVLVGAAPLAAIEATTASPAQQTAALQVLRLTRPLQSGPVRASYGFEANQSQTSSEAKFLSHAKDTESQADSAVGSSSID
jgi:hypothetical protein